METILPKLLVDLGIAVLAGALGSLGTTWIKTVLGTQKRAVNAVLSILMVTVFSYIVTIYYGGFGVDTFVVVAIFANIDAKALYEAAKLFSTEKKAVDEAFK